MATFGAWRADASQIRPGSIVKLKNPRGSTGAATHSHWFVVISPPDDQIELGTRFVAVAVSSAVQPTRADPAIHFPMPYANRRGGHVDTGFTKLCFACLDWAVELEVLEGDEFDLEIRADHSESRFLGAGELVQLLRLWGAYTAGKTSSKPRPKQP